jgi:hypothetical protein
VLWHASIFADGWDTQPLRPRRNKLLSRPTGPAAAWLRALRAAPVGAAFPDTHTGKTSKRTAFSFYVR